jgi:hypothetical protein
VGEKSHGALIFCEIVNEISDRCVLSISDDKHLRIDSDFGIETLWRRERRILSRWSCKPLRLVLSAQFVDIWRKDGCGLRFFVSTLRTRIVQAGPT